LHKLTVRHPEIRHLQDLASWGHFHRHSWWPDYKDKSKSRGELVKSRLFWFYNSSITL